MVKSIHRTRGGGIPASTYRVRDGLHLRSRLARLGVISNTVKVTGLSIRLRQLKLRFSL
jgi:hypothetical protein